MLVPHLIAAAHVFVQTSAVAVYGWSPGRLWSSVALLLVLAGVVIGGLALARSTGRAGHGNGRQGGIVALVLGLTGAVIGGLVVAAAEGGPGTGYGIVGGGMAMVIGLIALVVGGLALVRSRRSTLQRGLSTPSTTAVPDRR